MTKSVFTSFSFFCFILHYNLLRRHISLPQGRDTVIKELGFCPSLKLRGRVLYTYGRVSDGESDRIS